MSNSLLSRIYGFEYGFEYITIYILNLAAY